MTWWPPQPPPRWAGSASKDATAALVSARDKVPPAVQPAVLNGILQSAELRLAAGDAKGAASLYGKLYTTRYPDRFRIAAWRGIVVADAGQRAKLVSRALAGKDHSLQLAALKAVRELGDAAVVKACLREWASSAGHLPTGGVGRPNQSRRRGAVHRAPGHPKPLRCRSGPPAGSPWPTWAMSRLFQRWPRPLPRGEAAEREAAREALTRVRGPGVREALLEPDCQSRSRGAGGAAARAGRARRRRSRQRAPGQRGHRQAGAPGRAGLAPETGRARHAHPAAGDCRRVRDRRPIASPR